MSGCRLAIIADDLSGALDSAAPFAARGGDARVVISLEALAAVLATWQGQWPDVIAVNTESRHLPSEVAALRVSEAVRLLKRVAPQQWFKKVDSTLRGQVVAECTALREALGLPLLLAPAVPAQGRTVRHAEVWVDGVPLADTTYQQDALSTPLVGPIDQAFWDSGRPLQCYRSGPHVQLPSGDCIADGESDEELSALYTRVLSAGRSRAMAGAAGLATAIAQRLFGGAEAPLRALSSVHAVLYAIGSRSPRAAEQLQQLRQHVPGLAVIKACTESSATPLNSSLTSGAHVVVPGEGEERMASQVAQSMATKVADIASAWREGETCLLFLTGGDIAMAVLTHLRVSYISVETEWSPGVALGCMDGDRRKRVMTKAGGFGDPQLLVRLHHQLGSRLASS